jgi:hypothetical protein
LESDGLRRYTNDAGFNVIIVVVEPVAFRCLGTVLLHEIKELIGRLDSRWSQLFAVWPYFREYG